MVITPFCKEKTLIREKIANIIIDNEYKKVFSLIGKEAKMVKLLPSNVKVYSAELQKDVYHYQVKNYPNYNLFNAPAHLVIHRKGSFDLIWLDFFGYIGDDRNLKALIVASRKLNTDGMIVVTSLRTRSANLMYNEIDIINNLPLQLINESVYINNHKKVNVYYLKKQHLPA